MTIPLERAVLELTTDNSELNSGIAAAKAQATDLGGAMKQVGTAIGDFWKTLGNVFTQTTTQTETLGKSVTGAGQKIQVASGFTAAWTKEFGKLAGAFSVGSLIDRGVTGAIGALQNLGSSILENASSLVDLSAKTGLSITTLQKLDAVAKQNGTDVQTFADAIFKMGANIATGTQLARKAAEDLGLDWQQLRAMSPEQQFNAVVAALTRMDDVQRRNADAIGLFGKSASRIIASVAGEYQALAGSASLAGETQIRALKDTSDALDRFEQRAKATATDVAGSFIEAGEQAAKQPFWKTLIMAFDAGPGGILPLLAASSQVGAPAKDVNLHEPAPAQSSVEALKAAEAGYRALTASQKDNIAAAIQLGKSNSDIIDELNITEGVLAVAKRAYEEQQAAVKKAADEAQRFADVEAEIAAAQVPLTLAQRARVLELDKLGVSEEKVATDTGASVEQIQAYNKSLKTLAESLAAVGKGFAAIPTGKLLLHSTDLRGLQLGGVLADTTPVLRQQMAAAKQIADETYNDIEGRMRALGVATRADLRLDAAAETERFNSMRASGLFTYRELEAQYKQMIAANEAAGTSWIHSWHDVLSSMKFSFTDALGSLASGLESAFSGNGSIMAAIKSFGKNIASNLASSLLGAIPVVGQFLSQFGGALVSGVTSLWNHFFGTAGRDAVTQFASSMGGFDKLHAQLDQLSAAGVADGEALWTALTQGVGRNNPQQAEQAIQNIQDALAKLPPTLEAQATSAGYQTTAQLQKAANDAVKLWQYMRDSGQYTAAEVADAWQKAQDAMTAMGDTTPKAVADAKQAVADLDAQIQSLQQSVDAEAPEEEMGVIEKQQRAKLKDLQDQRAEAAKTLDDLTQQMTKSMDDVAEAIKGIPDEITVRVNLDYGSSGGGSAPSGRGATHMAAGGFGRVYEPTLFLAGEAGAEDVAFSGAGRSFADRPIVVYSVAMLDGQVVSRNQVRYTAGTLAQGGVR